MKCIILAGGSGDALWPLSRRNYPKQFMYINKGRSLFQEAIVRNLPFCDEFYIVTNYIYENIVKGQLQTFQGLNYHLFLEELGRQTAPAVMVSCLCMPVEEEVLVVSTDHMILSGDYNGTIVRAKEMLEADRIVAIGCKGEMLPGHNYFELTDDGRVEYGVVGLHLQGCETYMGDSLPDRGVCRYLDSGIFLTYAKTFVNAVKQNKPGLYEACCLGKNRMRIENGNAVLKREWLETIPSVSVGEAVYTRWTELGKIKLVEAQFEWSRLLNLETLSELAYTGGAEQDISYNCENVAVINETPDKMVVTSGLKDVMVVNTKDALYVTKKGDSARIKEILAQEDAYSKKQKLVFDEGDIYYTTWGCKETLSRSAGYQVKKLTIFPGHSLTLHKHEKRSEHWSVVSGTATVLLDGKEREYKRNESIFVPVGVFHKISNVTAKDLVVIEVSVGESAGNMEEDMVQALIQKSEKNAEIVKLTPVLRDYLWGGKRLSALYGMGQDMDCVAESWVLSAHSAGSGKIIGGKYDGMNFREYLECIGKEALGWKCQPYERFPLLIKFIDATDKLSVQVHPEDTYAMRWENDYGKNEMWYILDAKEEAYVYLGFEKDMEKDEVVKRIEEGTLTEILHKVPVKKGDSIFVPARQIHAIGEGVLILEIQQSSNATYRLYDYKRKDKGGKLRPLHLEKALDNIEFSANVQVGKPLGVWREGKGYKKLLLEQCKYFSVWAYDVKEEAEFVMDDSSFGSFVVVSGGAFLETAEGRIPMKAGDSFFVPAGRRNIKIVGECHLVFSHV